MPLCVYLLTIMRQGNLTKLSLSQNDTRKKSPLVEKERAMDNAGTKKNFIDLKQVQKCSRECCYK